MLCILCDTPDNLVEFRFVRSREISLIIFKEIRETVIVQVFFVVCHSYKLTHHFSLHSFYFMFLNSSIPYLNAPQMIIFHTKSAKDKISTSVINLGW